MNAIPLTQTHTKTSPSTAGAAFWRLPPKNRLDILAAGFAPISLAQMEDVALLNRLDIKFVLSVPQLMTALENLSQDYWMLEVNGERLNHYRTLYFDTVDYDLYQAHVNRRPERYKVRCREYADSHLSFLEMKHRTRKDRTIKERIQTGRPVAQFTPDLTRWLREVSPLEATDLQPRLWNSFTRMTLVNKDCCERVTLDVDLAFANGGGQARLDGIAVAEVKMELGGIASPFLAQMRELRIPRRGFSKYAFGVALLVEGVKKNSLKPRLLWIEKIMKGSSCNDRTH